MDLSRMAAGALAEMDNGAMPNTPVGGKMNGTESANDAQQRSSAPMQTMTPQTDTPEAAPLAQTTMSAADVIAEVDSSRLRRPRMRWSREEEVALMTAMEDVGGQHWLRIIERYGEGGTVNESLKGRDSRNLYSKAIAIQKRLEDAGKELPHYLKPVRTGRRKHSLSGERESLQEQQRPKLRARPSAKKQEADTAADKAEEEGDEVKGATSGSVEMDSKVKKEVEVKVESKMKDNAIELDNESDGEEPVVMQVLPTKTPKREQNRQPAALTMSEADIDQDYEYKIKELKLRLAIRETEQARMELDVAETKYRRRARD